MDFQNGDSLMTKDYFLEPHSLAADAIAGQVLRDGNGVLPDVKFGNKVEPATMFAVMGAIVGMVQAGETKLWRTRVLQEFANLRGEIHQLREQIRALGVHISNEIDRGFLENDFRQLMATIKSYNANYPGYGDADYAKSHAEQLLQRHELRAFELLEHNDFSTILQVSTGFVTHHELMHFAERPLSVRENIYQSYDAFFKASLNAADAGSWVAREQTLTSEVAQALSAWQGHRPPTGTIHREVKHRGYTFDVQMNTAFTGDTWVRTSFNAYVTAVPRRHGGGGGRVGGGDRFLNDSAKGVGEHVADESQCWSLGGPSCSQLTGKREELDREIASFNAAHAGLRGRLGMLRAQLLRAQEGRAVAEKFQNMIATLVDTPNAFPPNAPE